MEITFDPLKNTRNIRDRGLSFERAIDFDFESATFDADKRKDYGEDRITAIGLLRGLPHVLIFTMRGEVMRVISFRKANKREVNRYEKTTRS